MYFRIQWVNLGNLERLLACYDGSHAVRFNFMTHSNQDLIPRLVTTTTTSLSSYILRTEDWYLRVLCIRLYYYLGCFHLLGIRELIFFFFLSYQEQATPISNNNELGTSASSFTRALGWRGNLKIYASKWNESCKPRLLNLFSLPCGYVLKFELRKLLFASQSDSFRRSNQMLRCRRAWTHTHISSARTTCCYQLYYHDWIRKLYTCWIT